MRTASWLTRTRRQLAFGDERHRQACEFSDGTRTIPACYVEFALRHPDADGALFGGFIADSADRIFESTDRRRPSA